MLTGLIALAMLPTLSMQEVAYPLDSAVAIGGAEAYFVKRSVRYRADTSVWGDMAVKRMALRDKAGTPLFDKEVTDDWFEAVEALPGEHKGMGPVKLLQERWLVIPTSASKDVEKPKAGPPITSETERGYTVIDLTTKAVRHYNGFANRHPRYWEGPVAAAKDWILVNTVKSNVPGDDNGASIVMARGDKEINLGPGIAAGVDKQGRVYATVGVDAETCLIKVYERNAWRTLGEGSIKAFYPDGSLFVQQPLADEKEAWFTVKNGSWTLIEQTWNPELALQSRGSDSSLLLYEHRDKAPEGSNASRYILTKDGATKPLSDLLPEGAQVWPMPQMLADGTVVVHARVSKVEKCYLFRWN